MQKLINAKMKWARANSNICYIWYITRWGDKNVQPNFVRLNIKDEFMISDNMVWRSLIGLDGLLYLCIRPNYLQWEVAFLKVSESHEMSDEQVDFLCISTICEGIRKLNILPCNLHKINQGPLRLLQRKHIIMKIKLCWYR